MELDIRYARNGGVAIAYQIVGEGNVDLVYVPDFVSNLVYLWEIPRLRTFWERVARSFRLILFDKRATGLSDHGPYFAVLETHMEDLRAVLDAANSTNPVVLASHAGCGTAALLAATYPERVRALALFHGVVRGPGTEQQDAQEALSRLRDAWGTQEFSDELRALGSPTLLASEEDKRLFANWLRVGASPAAAYALNRAWWETDLRDVLPSVRVPTLVLYRSIAEEDSLELARQIPTARAMRVSGYDYFALELSPEIPDELERFIAGEQAPLVPESVLTTVMFTDLVRSSERAAEMGDRAWRDLLAQHHALVRRELARFRGEERDTAGDGFFATFDGPARAIRAGEQIIADVKDLGLDVRVGIHVGECELHEGKVSGIAVVVGARIAAAADKGEVLVSRTVRDLVGGSGFVFEDRGERELKGIRGTWETYAVASHSD